MSKQLSVLWEYWEWSQLWTPLPEDLFAGNHVDSALRQGRFEQAVHYTVVAEREAFQQLRSLQAATEVNGPHPSGVVPLADDEIVVTLGYVTLLVKRGD